MIEYADIQYWTTFIFFVAWPPALVCLVIGAMEVCESNCWMERFVWGLFGLTTFIAVCSLLVKLSSWLYLFFV